MLESGGSPEDAHRTISDGPIHNVPGSGTLHIPRCLSPVE